MAGLTIKCPLCKAKTSVRTSDRPTPTTVMAELFCQHCGNFKGKFIGEITEIKTANWQNADGLKMQTFEQNKLKIPDDN